jgi:hypothetical protein
MKQRCTKCKGLIRWEESYSGVSKCDVGMCVSCGKTFFDTPTDAHRRTINCPETATEG